MKKQSNLSRLLEIAGSHKYLTYASWVLSAISALIALVPKKHRSGTYGCLQFPAGVINWIVFSKKFLLFFVFMIKRTRLCSYNIRIRVSSS